jgi:hypothetical protein
MNHNNKTYFLKKALVLISAQLARDLLCGAL